MSQRVQTLIELLRSVLGDPADHAHHGRAGSIGG